MSKDTFELHNAFYDLGASGYINVRWKNAWGLQNEAVDRPIMYEGKPIGVITAVDTDYVFGVVLFNAIPELNADNHITVGFEISDPKNRGKDK